MDTEFTRSLRDAARLLLLVLFLAPAFGTAEERPGADSHEQPGEETEFLSTVSTMGVRGGRLVTALRTEPKTLNPVIAVNAASKTIIHRIMADLIRINPVSQTTEPSLAKTWSISNDGRRYLLYLRKGVKFSDGQPFDADDVLFSFAVYLDEEIRSPNRDLLVIEGEPIKLRKLDSHTIEMELSEPYAVGERIFDSVAILPEHLLKKTYEEGDLANIWSLSTPPSDIVGLGPFRLKQYVPGSRCVLERNPHYWKTDRLGNRLPYLDELVFVFVPNEDAQVIRFKAGSTDVIDGLGAKNFSLLERDARPGGYHMLDLGPGLLFNFLVFNLNDLSGKGLLEFEERQAWFKKVAFRKAVSKAIDRDSIVKIVFDGRATALSSNVSPGNKLWMNLEIPKERRSIEESRKLLRDAGFSWDRENDLLDENDMKVSFSIVSSSGNSQRLEMAAIIQEDLREIGIHIEVVPIEHRSLVARVTRDFDYDACIMALSDGDADPNPQMPFLLSSGNLHLWNLGQREPATRWEAEIDRLMKEQVSAVDFKTRKRMFDRVQELMAEELPVVFLASPHILVGAKKRLGNFEPAIIGHSTLWNSDVLFFQEEH